MKGLMKKFVLLILIFFVFSGPGKTSFSQALDSIGIVDTIWVGDIKGERGEKIILPVYGFNDEEISGYSIPLRFSEGLICDSVSFKGTRVDYCSFKTGYVDDLSKIIRIGIIPIGQDPIPSGYGLLANLFFSIKEDAPFGTIEIDTFSSDVPPVSLYFTYTISVEQAEYASLIPVFSKDMITIMAPNSPPRIEPVSTQYVNEGESLLVSLFVDDPEGDSVELSVLNPPPKSLLKELGWGEFEFSWVPDFAGPFSSDGSPFDIRFVASDGEKTSIQSVKVKVFNVNSPPVLSLPEELTYFPGKKIEFFVCAKDLDKEDVIIKAFNSPFRSSFDEKNPGLFSWTPLPSDTGNYFISFVATDPFGAKDSGVVKLRVETNFSYFLSIDNLSGNLGSMVSLAVELDNEGVIAGMELFIQYDSTFLSLINVTKEETRIKSWEYYESEIYTSGSYKLIRIIGIADVLNEISTPFLDSGSGPVTFINLRVTFNPDFANWSIPVGFYFGDFRDNTFSTPLGDSISQDQIKYNDGAITIKKPESVLLGDINLNGLSFEIGDVVRFCNYFIDPVQFSFVEQQMLNSDVNEDGFRVTISDFVFLLRYILEMGPAGSGKFVPYTDELEVNLERGKTSLSVSIDSKYPVAGAYLVFKDNDHLFEPTILNEKDGFKIFTRKENGELRVLLYSSEGEKFPLGKTSILTFKTDDDSDILLKEATFSDCEGNLLKGNVSFSSLPEAFSLSQNYPNPFNPETYIEFTLPTISLVSLKIYNIRGQLVRTLLDSEIEPGVHKVRWDGTKENGEKVGSGVYFYQLKTKGFSQTKKMIFLK